MSKGKRFGSNNEIIAATEGYLELKDKSFHTHGIEKLGKRLWDYVDE